MNATRELRQFFGLERMPFDKETDTIALQRLSSVQSNLESLLLFAETRGTGLVCGQSGSGKSCLLRLLCSELHHGLYKPLYLCHASVSVSEFYTHIAATLGLPACGRRAALFRSIQAHVLELARKRVHPLLIIDEAHMLSTDILSEIRLLTNFEMDSRNALSVLLCGQDSFLQRLDLAILESLANSISITVRTKGLVEEETYAYIEKSIADCGGKQQIFTTAAMKAIHQFFTGLMRTVNNIARAGMKKAQLLSSQTVEAEHIKQVMQH
jgi:type II secretory pathway predicted ATPase ExeA